MRTQTSFLKFKFTDHLNLEIGKTVSSFTLDNNN